MGGAALTWESSGLSGDIDEPLFVSDYHNIIVNLPVAKSACVVKYYICC